MNRLLIRADANSEIGHGHMMRCLALAQAWRELRGPVTFVMASPSREVRQRVEAEGVDVVAQDAPAGTEEDARETCAAAERSGASWIVLDGRAFSPEFQEQLRAARPLLVLDDEARAPRLCADLVLNQNVHARPADYEGRAPGARLLLGCYYVLLRREFHDRRSRDIPPRATKLLVTLGGSDPDNVTAAVLRALHGADLAGAQVRVIAGGSNRYVAELRTEAARSSFAMEVRENVSDMPAQMEWADLAISGSGSTCWETAYLGLPAIVVVLSSDQKKIAEELERRGIAVSLGWHRDGLQRLPGELARLMSDRAERQRMSHLGQELVDGQGAARVVAEMEARR